MEKNTTFTATLNIIVGEDRSMIYIIGGKIKGNLYIQISRDLVYNTYSVRVYDLTTASKEKPKADTKKSREYKTYNGAMRYYNTF